MTLLRDEDGAPAKVTVGLPDGAQLSAHIWVASVGPDTAAAARLLHRGQRPAAARGHRPALRRRQPTTGCARSCCSASAGSARSARYCAISGHPQPEVFHTNEGHAGFLGVERIREYLAGGRFARPGRRADQGGHGLHHAHAGACRDRPVRQGADRGAVRCRGQRACRCRSSEVLALGAETYAGGDPSMFNMAVMGMRLAQRVNGVSRLHGQVSREMFTGLWPGFDTAEVPIGSITNGVHAPTWVAARDPQPGAGRPRHRRGRLARRRRAGVAGGRRRPRPDLPDPPAAAGAAGRRRRARGCGRRGGSAARRTPSSPGSPARSTRTS